MKKSFCMNCLKEVGEDIKKCECGGLFFVYGENFHFDKNGVVCDCGSSKFKSGMHLDYREKAVNSYSCCNCGNVIGTESYRDKEDLMYWG